MNLCNKYYETYFKLQEDRQLDDAYLSEQYYKYKAEHEAKLDTLRKQKNKQERIILTSIIVLVILLASYIFVFNKKQYNKNILEQEDIIYNALRQHVVTIYHKQKDNVYENILKEFNTFYPDAFEKFKSTYPHLTESQHAVCLLSFLSFRIKEIALILNLRENTISKYRNSIIKSTGVKSLEDIMRPFTN
jgi:DNA-binding CsgD family transcriptional regulator